MFYEDKYYTWFLSLFLLSLFDRIWCPTRSNVGQIFVFFPVNLLKDKVFFCQNKDHYFIEILQLMHILYNNTLTSVWVMVMNYVPENIFQSFVYQGTNSRFHSTFITTFELQWKGGSYSLYFTLISIILIFCFFQQSPLFSCSFFITIFLYPHPVSKISVYFKTTFSVRRNPNISLEIYI